MKNFVQLALVYGLLAGAHVLPAESLPEVNAGSRVTNGSAVFTLSRLLASPNQTGGTEEVRKTFLYYLPGSLNHLIWTNFIAHTNGRDMNIWLTRTHPPDWPAH